MTFSPTKSSFLLIQVRPVGLRLDQDHIKPQQQTAEVSNWTKASRSRLYDQNLEKRKILAVISTPTKDLFMFLRTKLFDWPWDKFRPHQDGFRMQKLWSNEASVVGSSSFEWDVNLSPSIASLWQIWQSGQQAWNKQTDRQANWEQSKLIFGGRFLDFPLAFSSRRTEMGLRGVNLTADDTHDWFSQAQGTPSHVDIHL